MLNGSYMLTKLMIQKLFKRIIHLGPGDVDMIQAPRYLNPALRWVITKVVHSDLSRTIRSIARSDVSWKIATVRLW